MAKISRIPYSQDTTITVTQGEYGQFSHKKIPALDIVGKNKTIYSPCNGKVRVATNNNSKKGYGTYLSLQDTDNENIRIILGHLKYNSLKVKAGDKIKIGQVLAVEGSTGNSTGSHCHMEIRNSNGIGYKSVCAYTGLPNKVGKYEVKKYLKEIVSKPIATSVKYIITAKEGLNLRQSNNTKAKVLTAIPYNTKIEVTETKTVSLKVWGKTKFNNKAGWCCLSNYTKKV